ncbi:hypothetical protein [Tellurirhabdus bombi]|uniref:hypothetical protein n=1 Tax=Tellurirhabdus bombi TaxID=2907205 RepID=UPI001F1A7E05|nr:hypothetical protein [Tellurirhabdus bombi]
MNNNKLLLIFAATTLFASSCKKENDPTPDEPAILPLALSEQITTKTILEDRVSNPTLPDYIVDKSVLVKSELTIKPGVTIAFARDTRFDVSSGGGVLIARGEAAKKIRFVGAEPTKGFWQGIVISSESNANELDQVEILNAGSRATYSTVKAGLALLGKAQSSLKNSLISLSDGYGLHVFDGASLNAFATNTFSKNTEAGVYVSAENVKKLDAASVFSSENGRNVVEITKSSLSESATEDVWAGFADKTPYRITSDLSVHRGLKLSPGVTLQMGRDVVFRIEGKGYLNAVGTADKRITLTGAEAQAGFWRGLNFSFTPSPQNVLDHVTISNGGSITMVSGQKANVGVNGTNAVATIKNCTITGSGGYGIFLDFYAKEKVNKDIATANSFEANAQGNMKAE